MKQSYPIDVAVDRLPVSTIFQAVSENLNSVFFHFLATMPRIDQDIKLDFKDVLFRPKRSTIRSRSDVSTPLDIQGPLPDYSMHAL